LLGLLGLACGGIIYIYIYIIYNVEYIYIYIYLRCYITCFLVCTPLFGEVTCLDSSSVPCAAAQAKRSGTGPSGHLMIYVLTAAGPNAAGGEGVQMVCYPLVNVYKKLWKSTIFNWKIHYKLNGHFQ